MKRVYVALAEQTGTSRNTAVKALRECNFDVVDAILKVG